MSSVILTFHRWTSAVLWCDETLYQIGTQSSNPRRSYCHFNIRPSDLEHALHVVLDSRIVFTTKFDLRQLIRAWILAIFMLIRSVTLWPWPLTRWPCSSWYIKRHLIKACTKFERNRAIPGWIIDNYAVRPVGRTALSFMPTHELSFFLFSFYRAAWNADAV